MTTFKNATMGPFTSGVDASTGFASRPRGSVPRASNLLIGKRGTLRTCDGSQILHAYQGAVQNNRGKITCTYLYAPTGVSKYYLAIIKALDQTLGPPQNLTLSDGGTGGTLNGTYFYEVTAIDGVGGETTVSNEASITVASGHKVTLTWNVVPNAIGYNVYRGTASGLESQLVATTLPVSQPVAGGLTVTFSDTGFNSGAVYTVLNASRTPSGFTFTLTTTPTGVITGTPFIVAGNSNPIFNMTFHATSVTGNSIIVSFPNNLAIATGTGGTMTLGTAVAPPVSDTTQQTALYQMPVILGATAALPVSYSNINIAALYPADNIAYNPGGGGGGGGSGSGGGTGASGSAGTNGPSNVTSIPQMAEFTNQVVIALGNGYPVQVFSDNTGTPVNPAIVANISSISVDAFGVVTITTSLAHGIPASQAGGSIVISGVANPSYNVTAAGAPAFVILSIPSTTTIKVRNLSAIGQAPSSGGTATSTSLPLISTFVPAYPTWTASVTYAVNSIVEPTVSNGHYFKAVQGGTSGASEPTWPTGTGQRVADGSIIWQEAGLLNSAAPPPPGGATICVYEGSLWVFNTSPSNTANGLDGPCSLRMSDVNNLSSWNPINQAFLDKDDGTVGQALATFTVAAQGIPPTGSLVAAKDYALYQIVGVFGSTSFSIQRAKTDLGCTCPRTMQFVPGYGITRFTHLGFAVFDGVDDRVISEPIRPYLFPSNDEDDADITVMDSSWQSVSWGAQTANPPMYVIAIPIGVSGGQLTRILSYDLIAKGWCITDLPFAISTMSQFKTQVANPVTVLGGFLDGALQRWQSGDELWYTGAIGAATPSTINFGVRTPTAVSKEPDEILYCRESNVRGINTTAGPLTLTPLVDGAAFRTMTQNIPSSGDFTRIYPVMQRGTRFEANISGSGIIEFDAFTFGIEPRPAGVLTRIS